MKIPFITFLGILFAVNIALADTKQNKNITTCSSAEDCESKSLIEYHSKKNYAKYIEYQKQRCYKFEECYTLSTQYYKGEFVKQSYKKAIELMKPYCYEGRPVPCETVAYMYEKGDKTLKPDKNKAEIYRRKAAEYSKF